MRVKTRVLLNLIGIPMIILAAQCALSNPILLGDGSKTVPYEDGGRQSIPSAAARIICFRCRHVPGGEQYDFEVGVFETCWEPIYSIELEGIEGTTIQAVASPTGWTASMVPDLVAMPGRVIFSTQTDPIVPGTRMCGFSVLSTSGTTVLRWYPANQEGLLMGKVTREDFSCPTRSDSPTWGSVKALYK